MSNTKELYLHEEIMLLSLKDREGTIEFGVSFVQAAAGAILSELLLNNRIEMKEDKKKKNIHLKNPKSFGDPILDECLDMIGKEEKLKDLRHWIFRFSSVKNLKNKLAQSLSRKGILKEDEDKVLLIFTRKIYPETNPLPEQAIIKRLENAIFTDSQEIDPRTVILISIANQTGILRVVIDKNELKNRKKRIEQITNGEVIGKAAKEAIEAVQAAVMVACIMPTVITTTT
ncbi:MAG: GPP34 family phosphoprotein [bacterium]|nr:GPP34 family phosphoprotein [bacterium]